MESLVEFLNLIQVGATLELKAGDKLFHQYHETQGLFLIQQGQIQLLRDTIDGNSVILYTAQGGETIAEASLFSEKYHCHAKAISECTVFLYEKKIVLDYLQTNSDYALQFIKLLAKQVQSLRSLIEIRGIKSPQERVVQYLLVNLNDTKQFTLNSTYKDFAVKLGMTHETLYRVLAKLEKNKVISRENNQIKYLI